MKNKEEAKKFRISLGEALQAKLQRDGYLKSAAWVRSHTHRNRRGRTWCSRYRTVRRQHILRV
eukprot:671468-Pyramimonas_sp.AAC.1